MIGRFSVTSSSSSLQDHVEEHDRKATQPTVNAETAKKQLFRQTMLKPNVEAWVWAFVDSSFAYRLADSESFRAALQHAAAFPGRKAIKNGMPASRTSCVASFARSTSRNLRFLRATLAH
jgi:hypothetical protein